jgi:uncharacterized membrane protein
MEIGKKMRTDESNIFEELLNRWRVNRFLKVQYQEAKKRHSKSTKQVEKLDNKKFDYWFIASIVTGLIGIMCLGLSLRYKLYPTNFGYINIEMITAMFLILFAMICNMQSQIKQIRE